MKRFLMACLFALALAGAVRADYLLWWDLDFTDESAWPWGDGDEPKYVQIVAHNGDEILTFSTRTEYGESVGEGWFESGELEGAFNGYATTVTDTDIATIEETPGYWFTVELALEEGNFSWTSAGKTWAELQAGGAVANIAAGSETVALTPWTPGGWSVPEPNSALLLVIGGALLALRRRTSRPA